MKHYRDYFWKEGAPCGISFLKNLSSYDGISYQIISDPYRKRISIEEYRQQSFKQTIYDSALLDFRRLNPTDQTAWEKVPVEETEDHATCLIRNQDGRAIFFEEYRFAGTRCRSCRIKSVHGYPISTQKILYTSLGDPFNGVILYDMNQHLVMYKRYKIDEESGEFTQVIEENWNMQNITAYEDILGDNIEAATLPFLGKAR